MFEFLSGWIGNIEINGIKYNSYSDIPSDLTLEPNTTISLFTVEKSSDSQRAEASEQLYRITVRQYMTKKSTDSFQFMKQWNNDEPMPLRIMVGKIIKETPGMYKMELSADTIFEKAQCCMKCGKVITNNVSKYFGMGPECGQHNYTNPFNSDEELEQAISKYKQEYLANIKWTGWVIKSAITEMEEL